MPYINITEQDINPSVSFDTVENAVLIFGPDFHIKNITIDSEGKPVIEKSAEPYKLYASISDFVDDFQWPDAVIREDIIKSPIGRPYITAYDCLVNSLPVMYVPIDDYFNFGSDGVLIHRAFRPGDSEATPPTEDVPEAYFLDYDILSNPEDIDNINNSLNKYDLSSTEKDNYVKLFTDASKNTFVESAIFNLINSSEGEFAGPWLADKINFPITFITTCGFENKDTADIYGSINEKLDNRLDLVYLYDVPKGVTPEDLSKKTGTGDNPYYRGSFTNAERVNFVYPWGTYNSYTYSKGALSMPASYGYLMAYANSIKNNKPWLAVAGVNRGIIPNIVGLDYKIRESYVHLWQGDEASADLNLPYRINPIVNLGSTYGTVIFGNRTCYVSNPNTTEVFKEFLNIRLLLAFIHKQAFNSSVQHMFEPNDDIVWLSFKQKVNVLLDKMVSGRGIKWYKWYKIKPNKLDPDAPKIGEIRAQLVIRPIEAVESFKITIIMTDEDVEMEVSGMEG